MPVDMLLFLYIGRWNNNASEFGQISTRNSSRPLRPRRTNHRQRLSFVRPSICSYVRPFCFSSVLASVLPSLCLVVLSSVRPFVRPSVLMGTFKYRDND